LCILYAYDRCTYLYSVCDTFFTGLYAGAFFQLINGLMSVCGCNFIMAWRFVGTGFTFEYLHIISFCMMSRYCFSVCFMVFLVVFGWVVADFCEFVILYEVVYFMLALFLLFLCLLL
jgi:hypothetical protein